MHEELKKLLSSFTNEELALTDKKMWDAYVSIKCDDFCNENCKYARMCEFFCDVNVCVAGEIDKRKPKIKES